MGAYLSQPKTDKVSKEEFNDYVTVGSSSMQGWRNSQEDAHNVILDFDSNTSFFAVYDGHGGAEVATYCADRMPQFLKELEHYTKGDLETALKQAFLKFDSTLLEPSVVEILKILAGEKNFDESDGDGDEEDGEDLVELHEESRLPLNELMEKYKGHPSLSALNKLKEACSSNGSKPQSPYLRGRRSAAIVAEATNKAIVDPDSKPAGTSTSAAALALLRDDGPCSSKAASSSGASTSSGNLTSEEQEGDSTVTSSSSGSKAGNNTENAANKESESIEAEASEGPATNGPKIEESTNAKQNEQNGRVTSSEVKIPINTNAGAQITSTDAAINENAVSASVDESKQNGAVDSSSFSGSSAKIDGGISSTSKGVRKSKKTGADDDDSTDDDYHVDNMDEQDKTDSSGEEGMDDDEEDEDEDIEQEDSEFDSEPGTDEYEEEDEEDIESTLANEQFCANMIEEPGKDSGCTAVVALLKGRDLYVANAGDSRCVVCRNGMAIEMSLDHKPEDDEECARIMNAGGRVTVDGRVNGGLNLSRAIGDHAYKMNSSLAAEDQMISALPDIKKLIIQPEDEFMILACDGIWNFMSSEEVVEFVRKRLQDETKTMSKICEELFDLCLAPDTMGDGTGCDNMTAVIVRFKPKILELETKINPTETEDVLLAKKATDAKNNGKQEEQVSSLKRLAMPALLDGDDDSNEAEQANRTKRLKTDHVDCGDEKVNQNHSLPTSSSNHDASNKMDQTEDRDQECDSVSSAATDSLKVSKCTTENVTQPEGAAAVVVATTTTTATVVSST